MAVTRLASVVGLIVLAFRVALGPTSAQQDLPPAYQKALEACLRECGSASPDGSNVEPDKQACVWECALDRLTPAAAALQDLPKAKVPPRPLSDEDKLRIGNERALKGLKDAIELDILKERGLTE